MTSAQLEQHQAIARDFVQVQYLGGEVADIYFAGDGNERKAISARLAAVPISVADAGIWRDDHVVVDVWSPDGSINSLIKPAIEACEREALN